MERHFHEQLDDLKKKLIDMALAVEEAIEGAVDALVKREDDIADHVIQMDETINQMEIRIDEICLSLLALQQPMAIDLRFVTSAMKINNDLERMGDHAVNVAQLAKKLNHHDRLKPLINIPRMAEIVQSMVKDSIDSFVNANAAVAKKICERDDEVDHFDDQLFRELITYMMSDPKNIPKALNYVLISKNLERVADLSTNIAEEVIFIYRAKNIKHHTEEIFLRDIRSRS
ncbi:phosphate signaling complex protein PhoU [bacterium]|nr:phosphate signaling complex protein PhoU [bacterium]